MWSTMANNQYTVAWNIGNLGHLIKAIIGAQKYNARLSHDGSNSHYPESGLHGFIDIVHPFDESKIDKSKENIRPFFANPSLRFFPLYMNFIKMNIKTNVKDFVETYWNHKEVHSSKCFNIDVTNFFLDTDKFIKDMEKFLQEKLTEETKAFITAKKQHNWPLYEKFKAITRLDADELADKSDLVKALYICINAQDDYKKAKDLLKKYA